MKPDNFKPMLAVAAETSQVKFPVMASVKLDGLRGCIFGGVAYSRSLKPLPNLCIQQWCKLNQEALEGLDGEFIVGSETDPLVFSKTTSVVMSIDKVQDFTFFAFDVVDETKTAFERYQGLLQKQIKGELPKEVWGVTQVRIENPEQLEVFEKDALEQGFEGTMLKSLDGKYKFGRSTVKSQQLLKRKLFVDSEFEIVGFEPKYHNANEAVINELGRTSRSTSKEGLVALDTLGALLCKTPSGTIFGVGTGFDDATRKSLWNQRESLTGQLAKVKYFEVGMQDGVPRFPVFISTRSELDMSN
jgi:DNA ligase-1